ncbi:MAG: thiamine pyrophosphate-dependent dehydrogenase E1 component subunit alpha [Desulfobacterales bacterium]|nr:thiamine pyrophosphate-dependent dehydrogenase E1 component subunit alpha [Desulfobacterales bacterium]
MGTEIPAGACKFYIESRVINPKEDDKVMGRRAKNLSDENLIDLYRTMIKIRLFEEKIIDVYSAQDMRTPVHLYIGQEAIAAGVCLHLGPKDYITTNHRSHGHCLAKGMDPKVLFAELYGKRTGCCRGKGGSMHPASVEHGILGTSAIVGGGIALAVGNALAANMRREKRVTVAFFGDGATEEGIFFECLNFASLKRLPVVFICENNLYATNSPITNRQPNSYLWTRGGIYDIEGYFIYDNDVLGICQKAREAINKARSGFGPSLLECRTYRWKGHVGPEEDHEKGARPKSELDLWKNRCPIKCFRNYLIYSRKIRASLLNEIENTMRHSIDEAWQIGKNEPYPDQDELYQNVYFQKTT